MTIARHIAVLASTFMLSACLGDAREAQLADYNWRLANSLDAELPTLSPLEITPLPGKRQLSVVQPRHSIDLLDFLALGDCTLSQALARRNSNLGKFRPASQQLLFQLEFLQLAPDCIEQLEKSGDTELAAQLLTAQQSKLEHLDDYIWQALLGGSEFRDFWRQPQKQGDYPEHVSGEVIAAMAYLQQQATAWLAREFLRKFGKTGGQSAANSQRRRRAADCSTGPCKVAISRKPTGCSIRSSIAHRFATPCGPIPRA